MQASLLPASADLEKVAKVLLELRPQYNLKSMIIQIEQQQKAGYQIAYVQDKQDILSVAGFVIAEKLAWGKHIYIDDLVTCKSHRGTGAGSFLMNWLKDYAKQQGCEQMHLDSGVQRFAAHRFYLREQFNIASHHFTLIDFSA